MQEGSLRCDANVNVKIETDAGTVATPIVEVKNLNSFSGVQAAIEFEVVRQIEEYRRTGRKLGDPGVQKETRGWNVERNESTLQRGKEEEADYRYFPDPDLVPVTVTADEIEELRKTLCEAPTARRLRFERQFQLSPYDARVLVDQGREFADYFEQVVAVCADGKLVSNFVTQDLLREAKARRVGIAQFPLAASVVAGLLKRVKDGAITLKSAREVFEELLRRHDARLEENDDHSPAPETPDASVIDEIIIERGLALVTDTSAIDAAIAAAIADSPRAIEDFRSGKQQALGAVIGKVMKQVKGADPKTVRESLLKTLAALE
jgi:aspartyl-tRNA(Asn)/glutamyl-tRNA(Gln) amidotransferase subunit B